MRIIIVIIILLFTGLIVFGQPTIKIHAYKQANIPGARPIEYDEQGNRKPYVVRYNYWFYLEYPKTSGIAVTDVWIEGKRYKLSFKTVGTLPVTKIINSGNVNPDTVLLVPKTTNKVLLFRPADTLNPVSKPAKYLSDLIKESELAVGYLWKGKKYFKAVKTIVNLPAEVHQ